MKVTKFEHSCVRVERDGAVLVIDPGPWASPAALDGVDAVLITHEHFDHLDVEKLADTLARRPTVTVHAHASVMLKLGVLKGVLNEVSSGQEFTAAGFGVKAYGGLHALVHPDVTPVPNLGFLVEGSVYHPGDSFDVPVGAEVETLFVPVSGPWLKISESVDFVRAIGPRRAIALHDGLLNDMGHMVGDANMTMLSGCDYSRLEPGATLAA
ncbi:L-ascorbate metabolism protein UlaG (beta-lactamase superfamily) [Allocatelliglobosispora scoriae]|uniref:L-ascorbate metabolism protein UlaG (Beta-lactamase superfamily) n=1 Tax=Allocatelliglobosispora scoriae TaxID=643052 RepID=A0A841BUH6_9ACTN|nr:MBL fold metallo-hydrolase [Allocatelliglobosispora scoriae]MBB5870392.1 L-ascorbate metabolism protein UlaG (beta-lactamase superfamily) [Allocatelliglobosispora scoriae]